LQYLVAVKAKLDANTQEAVNQINLLTGVIEARNLGP